MNRFRQLKENTGWGGVARTVVLAVVCLGVVFFGPESFALKPTVLGALFLPALLSRSFAKSPGAWSSALRFGAWALFALALVGPQMRDKLDAVPEVVTILWGVIALYIGLFFWFWSHPEVICLDQGDIEGPETPDDG